MRKYIDIVSGKQIAHPPRSLTESVAFHPSVAEKGTDGDTVISWPPGSYRVVDDPCQGCDATGKQDGRTCNWCDGEKTFKKMHFDCPMLDVANANGRVVAKLLGHDDVQGWIEPFLLPSLKNRLIKIRNGGPDPVIGGERLNGVSDYVDRLIEMIDWALAHKTGISWSYCPIHLAATGPLSYRFFE
jgi:hypothetical protein